ncbi:zinc finger protein 234-like [Lineus longissimus]|uniref:zinc finger protein 234-like n=1 Tax=Lineus longissimus TaxID=88925 RepID=UPI00315DC114
MEDASSAGKVGPMELAWSEAGSENSELSSDEENETCSEKNFHGGVFPREYNNVSHSDSGNKKTRLGLRDCDISQNVCDKNGTVMMNSVNHGEAFYDDSISRGKVLLENNGLGSKSLKNWQFENEDQLQYARETGGVAGKTSPSMKMENDESVYSEVSNLQTINRNEALNNGAMSTSSCDGLGCRDGVQTISGTDGNELVENDEDAPNVGTGLLKIQVEDPLHGDKVKLEELETENSDSETDVEASDTVPSENNVKTEPAPASHRPPFPLPQWLDREARNHTNQKASEATSSSAVAPSSSAADFLGSDSSQMIRFLSEKISSALSGVTEDFLNRGQAAITEKISDVLFDVYGPMQGQSGSVATGATVFPDSKPVTVKKPAVKRRKMLTQGKAMSSKTSSDNLKVDSEGEAVDLTKARRNRSAKKNYHCQKCDKAFSLSIQLKKHVCPFVDEEQVATATEASEKDDSDGSDEETEIDEVEAEPSPKVGKKTKVEKRIWKCDTCGDVFPWKKGLTKHMRVHRPSKPRAEVESFQCHCGKRYASKGSLQSHKHLHHGEMPYRCPYCCVGFVKIQHMRAHEKTAHPDEKKYECETCKKRFNDRRNFRQHQLIHGKRKQYVCELCGKAYSHIKSLRVHRAIHTEGKKFSCDICGKGFVYKCYLAIHERIHTGLKPYVCQVCGKGFKASGALGIHERIHSGDKPYKCPVESCGKEFSQQSNLVIHERTHTGEKPYKCDVCSKTFARGGDLVKHKDTHVVNKPFKCDYCPKSFSRNQLLIEHARCHTGDKPYICQVCGKGFARCQSVVEHERIHSGIKPFACELCGKAFTYSSHLTIHRRTHSGERPYKCRYCTRTFTNISNRIKHERTHTGEKPYQCRHCGKRFNVKGDMMRHELTHAPADYSKVEGPADYSKNIARHESAHVPLYEERGVVESNKALPSYVDMGNTGFNPNNYMFQQL